MTETIDRLKTLRGNAAYPYGGTCKICGFSDADLPGDQRVCFRFSDVCGLHDCRVKAGVCDCIACQKLKKADIEREKQIILTDLVAVKNSKETPCWRDRVKGEELPECARYENIAERAEKLLGVSSD